MDEDKSGLIIGQQAYYAYTNTRPCAITFCH